MANLRILSNNLADASTVTATAATVGLPVTNLKSDIKSAVWRSTAVTTATVAATWPAGVVSNVAVLAFCNLTPTATVRVRAYTLAADASPAVDVTRTDAVQGGTQGGVNTFAYGGGVYAAVYYPSGLYEKVSVTVTDAANPAGYIEASRLLVGQYWEPVNNTEYGLNFGVGENSRNERTDAGDLRTDRGTIWKTLNFDLNFMPKADRDKLYNILRQNGLYRPLFVSISPNDTEDAAGEQVFQIYGKLSKMNVIKYQFMNQFGTQLEVEEV